MKIELNNFSGIAPITPARYLANEQAQTAENVATWTASLRPIAEPGSALMGFTVSGTTVSLYRFGEDETDQTKYWFQWNTDVDVVRGFIAGDTSEKTFYTGDGTPKATDNVLALTGGFGDWTLNSYPLNYYELGVLAPTQAPVATIQGLADDPAFEETRTYTYTFVNSWGQESAPYLNDPMPASATVTHQTGQQVIVQTQTGFTGNYNIVSKRIYRSTAGVYLFVGEIPLAQESFLDIVLPDDLNEELPSLTWLEPPTTLKGLTELAGGVLAGFDGIDVYFSEPYRPFAWPVQYQQSMMNKVVGLAGIDTTLVVLTQGQPVFLQGSDPGSMIVVDADINQACVAKRSIVEINGSVFYASPDGLVSLSPGGSTIVTANYFDRATWQSYFKPETIHAYTHDNLYIGFYNNGSQLGGFIYDIFSGTFQTNDIYVDGAYTDLKNDTLYLSQSGALKEWQAGAASTYTWKSKVFTMSRDVGFTCYRVDAETYPVNFILYRDGVAIVNTSVTSGDVQRIPAGTGRDYEVELSGTAEVYSVTLAQSPSEL